MLYIPALRYTSLKVQYHKKIHFFQPFFPNPCKSHKSHSWGFGNVVSLYRQSERLMQQRSQRRHRLLLLKLNF